MPICLCMQAILITDPVLATHITRSKMLDKFRFMYHRLDPARALLQVSLQCQMTSASQCYASLTWVNHTMCTPQLWYAFEDITKHLQREYDYLACHDSLEAQ